MAEGASRGRPPHPAPPPPADGSLPRFELTAAEHTELGHQLYELLAQFDGYVAAMVGWDPESFVDLAELRSEWSDELDEGGIHGLVLCEECCIAVRSGREAR
ncbi:hypothetical protein ABZ896_25910 [Streptomyces sp. NPDC047072]|uniref:hypothetical protein n=1 Tax=Streptomyces sp. NPDC047072 TaxID=3154809 RepID=UPI0033C36F71